MNVESRDIPHAVRAAPRPRSWLIVRGLTLIMLASIVGMGYFIFLAGGPGTAGGWVKDPGRPVIGGSLGTCFDISVLHTGGLYRAWFSWRPHNAIAYVESPDGISWSTPVIALAPTNSGWELAVNRPIVIAAPAGYAMWYTGQTQTASAIGYATSHDGIVWTRMDTAPVLVADRTWEKQAVMSPDVLYDSATGQYRMWYSGGEQYEPDAIGYATSSDGIHWAKYSNNPVFAGSGSGNWDGAKVAAAYVMPDAGGYVMFYIGYADDNNAQIGFARSVNGIDGWQRATANPIIRPGHFLDWDHSAVYRPSVLHEDGRWVLWYNGRQDNTEQIGRAVHAGDDLGH